MLKKIWNGVTTAIVAAVVLLAVLLAGARLLGLQVYTVISGSMEPKYHVGSIIYVKSVPPEDLREGDDISFLIGEDTVATHRIIEVIPDETDPDVIRFRTKGINNEIEDTNPVHCKNVLGKVVGTIPLLGYVSDYVQHPPGTFVVLGVMAILVIAFFVPDIVGGLRELKAEKAPEQVESQEELDREKIMAELEALKQKLRQQNETESKNDEENG